MDKLRKISRSILLFVFIFLVSQIVLVNCFGLGDQKLKSDGNIYLQTLNDEYPLGKLVQVKITNGSTSDITLKRSPQEPPLQVYKLVQNELVLQEGKFDVHNGQNTDLVIPAGRSAQINFKDWNNQLFGETGIYNLSFEAEVDGKLTPITSNNFQVKEPGIFRQFWNGIIYRPIYNALILFSSYAPGASLGIGIIILTIFIRTILLVPAGKAMKSQRRMAEIQPKLQAIKEKYKGDQQRIAMETMALWKEAKVSPTGSCLPLLLQFPFLIAIYYAVQNGISPDNHYLLYTTYNNIELSQISTNFLGLDLLTKSIYILPVIVGTLQFIQLKLATAKSGNKNKNMSKEMQTANQTMTYLMPALIAVFTASLPSGVGIYWGTSTLYGIVQQIFVNKSSDKDSQNDVKVKVIKS